MNLNQLKRVIAKNTCAHYEESHRTFNRTSDLDQEANPLYADTHNGHHHAETFVYFDDDFYFMVTWCANTDAYHWEKYMNQVDRVAVDPPADEIEVLDHIRSMTTYGNYVWEMPHEHMQNVKVTRTVQEDRKSRRQHLPAHTSQYDVSV